MTKYEQLFNLLNADAQNSPDIELYVLLKDVLKDFANELTKHPEESTSIAYSIAGLMATNYARALDSDNPIDEILTIAGELEIDPANADTLRQELVQKIDEL